MPPKVFRYPLRVLGAELGRTVTVLPLRSGETVIHSTAPFSEADVKRIRELGSPVALVEATVMHDTFAREGTRAFPGLPYFVPEGFPKIAGVRTTPLAEASAARRGEIEVLRLEGMPKVNEHVFLHVPSRTLVVADLVFNFGPDANRWTRLLFRYGSGIRSYPGTSRLFRFLIRDRAAFTRSIQQMLAWDFDRVIPGHGEIIESGGKARLRTALREFALE